MQALCSEAPPEIPPRRMVTGGLDFRRFDQVLAVMLKHGKVPLFSQDVRANVLGGAPAAEPAVDAAMAAAVMTSFYEEVQMPQDMAFVGEIDLGGVLLGFELPRCSVLGAHERADLDVATGHLAWLALTATSAPRRLFACHFHFCCRDTFAASDSLCWLPHRQRTRL